MAIKSGLYHLEGQVIFDLYPGEKRLRIADDPDDRHWPFYFYWDGEKLEQDIYEFLGIEVLDVSQITDDWLEEIDKLTLPRLDIPDAGLSDVSVTDALRWARKTYPSRYTGVKT